MTSAEAREEIYELTPMKQGMLFRTLLDPSAGHVGHVIGILNTARMQDATSYRPRRGHHAPPAVFRAEEKNDPSHPEVGALLADDTLGWTRFNSSPVAAFHVPGTHLTLVREPHVDVLATRLLVRLAG